MTKILFIFTLLFISCSSTTKLIEFEVKTEKGSPSLRTISFVQYNGLSSSPPKVLTVREDQHYIYYEYSSLLHNGEKTGSLVVAYNDNQSIPAEVYDLKRCGLKLSNKWSEWCKPQFSRMDKSELPSVATWVLYSSEASQVLKDDKGKNSQMRFKMSEWKSYKK